MWDRILVPKIILEKLQVYSMEVASPLKIMQVATTTVFLKIHALSSQSLSSLKYLELLIASDFFVPNMYIIERNMYNFSAHFPRVHS